MFTRQEIEEYLELLYKNRDDWSATMIAQLLRQLDEREATIHHLREEIARTKKAEIKSDWFYNRPSLEG